MCLEKLDEEIEVGTGIGYKAFETDKSYHLEFPCFGGRIKYDEWYHDKAEDEIAVDYVSDKSYPTGYHVFLSLQDAKEWGGLPVRKVEYRDVVASGTQGSNRQVVVAREIRILKGKV